MKNIRFILYVCFIFITACRPSEDKIRKTDLIPVDNMVPILVEMHLADGLMETTSIRMRYPGRDSISNYQDVLRKHGYSKEVFDKTIAYYNNDPEKLNDLYEVVIEELTKFQSEVQQIGRQKVEDDRMPDLWNQKAVWHLPDDGRINRVPFNIPVSEPGKYILTATIRMHLDDGSINPRITAYFWFNDGTEAGYRIPFETSKIKKNSRIQISSPSNFGILTQRSPNTNIDIEPGQD